MPVVGCMIVLSWRHQPQALPQWKTADGLFGKRLHPSVYTKRTLSSLQPLQVLRWKGQIYAAAWRVRWHRYVLTLQSAISGGKDLEGWGSSNIQLTCPRRDS